MANIIRYVNTDSTPLGDGTTSATTGANRAYASLNEWEAAEQVDLVTAGNTHEVRCLGSLEDTAATIVDGWTTNAANFITIRSNPGNQHSGKWDTAAYILTTSDTGSHSLELRESFTVVDGLQVTRTGTGNFRNCIHANDVSGPLGDLTLKKCILREQGSGSNRVGANLSDSKNTSSYVYNCLAYDFIGGKGFEFQSGGILSHKLYSTTMINCLNGVNVSFDDVIAINCLYNSEGLAGAQGFAGDFQGISKNNLSDLADAPGTASQTGTPTFADAANDNWHLALSDTLAQNNGVDLSADADIPFSDDIDSLPRLGTWDIGMDETSVALTLDAVVDGEGFVISNLIIGVSNLVITQDSVVIDEADSALNWYAGNDTSSIAVDPDIKVHGTNAVSTRVNGITIISGLMFDMVTPTDLSNTHLIIWFTTMQAIADQLSGGIRIRVSGDFEGLDNYGEWFVRGSDTNIGPRASFQPLAVDTSRPFDNVLNTAPALTAVRSVGVTCSFVSANGRISLFVDVMRRGNNGLTIKGGSLALPGTSNDIADEDEIVSNAYGLLVRVGGTFLAQGLFKFGDVLLNDSFFVDSNKVWVFSGQPVSATFHRVECVGNALSVNTFELGAKVGVGITADGVGGYIFLAEGDAPLRFIAVDANAQVNLYGCSFLNSLSVGGFIQLEQANVESVSCLFASCDSVTVRNGAVLRKATITDSTSTSTSAALDFGAVNPNATPDSVRDVTVISGVNGVLLSGTGDTSYDFNNIVFSGQTGKKVRVAFGAADTVTINILNNGSGILQSDLDIVTAGTTVIISNPVTTLINVKDNNKANLVSARVFLEASDATGSLPYQVAVTLTRVATTATVAHTAHGLGNGDLVAIRGAVQQEYNGAKTISNVSTNAYDFTVSGSPTTPATGSINSTGVILSGLTDASGNISASRTFGVNTPVHGRVRKSSASPRFKTSPLNDTVNSTSGLTVNVQMIVDE